MSVTFFLGIRIQRSSTYFSPIFWFFVSISGWASTSFFRSSIVLTPRWYISFAFAAPIPHTLVICSKAIFYYVFLSFSSLLIDPVFKSSLILSTILSPICFWVYLSLSTSSSVSSSQSNDFMAPIALEYAILRPLSPSLVQTFNNLASYQIMNLLLDGFVISFSFFSAGFDSEGYFLSFFSSYFSTFVRFLGFPYYFFKSSLSLSLKLPTGTTLPAATQLSTKEISIASLQLTSLLKFSLISAASSRGSHNKQSALIFLPCSAHSMVSSDPPCSRISIDRFSIVRLLRVSVRRMKLSDENRCYLSLARICI